MNFNLKEVFRDKAINKANTIKIGVDTFPHYMLEYLIANYDS